MRAAKTPCNIVEVRVMDLGSLVPPISTPCFLTTVYQQCPNSSLHISFNALRDINEKDLPRKCNGNEIN